MGDTKGRQHVMKSIEGKFVAVKTTTDGMKLCVVDQQSNANSVSIVNRHSCGRNQMALRFRHGDGDYVTMVTGNKLEVNKLDTSSDDTNLPDSHWFEKYNGKRAGEHYGLRSVAQPSQYLSIQSTDYIHYIILSENSNDCVLVTDKRL